MRLYWISWWQPTADVRPVRSPPNSAVLGWWCTGERGDGAASLCALVRAKDEYWARAAILIDWGEARDWRFCEPREDTELSDRFPLSDWMIERMTPNVELSGGRRPSA
jgi:hypothetical protein